MFILLNLSLSFSLPETTPKYIVLIRTVISLIIIFGGPAYFFIKFISKTLKHNESEIKFKKESTGNEKNIEEFEESKPYKFLLFLAVFIGLVLIFLWIIGLIAKGFGY